MGLNFKTSNLPESRGIFLWHHGGGDSIEHSWEGLAARAVAPTLSELRLEKLGEEIPRLRWTGLRPSSLMQPSTEGWQELFSAKRIICCTPKCSGPNMMKYFSKNLESQSGEVNVLIHVFSQTNECLVRVGSWRKKKKLSWKILFKSCYEIF